MNLTPLVLAMTLLGTAGNLHAAKSTHKAHHRAHKKAVTSAVYKVKRGETAAKIAAAHGMGLDDLAELNPKISLSKLKPGMTLHLAPQARVARVVSEPVPLRAKDTPRAIKPSELPATPHIAPSNLVHMERVLPSGLMRTSPEEGEGERTPAPRNSALRSGSFDEIQAVLPSVSQTDQAATLPFEPANPDNLNFLWPVETRTVSSVFGPRMRTKVALKKAKNKRMRKVAVRYQGSHKGVDLSAPQGTDIYAAQDGQVIASGFHRQHGNFVVIDHGNGVTTLYAHAVVNFAHEGEVVRRGQKIAAVGRTGHATGPHLHFEVRVNGIHRNPEPYLNETEEIDPERVAQNQLLAPQR